MSSRFKFPRRVRIHGGECGAVARALHHAAQKGALVRNEQSLISDEKAFLGQAGLKKAFGSTFDERKQMSTKTSIKRVALIAVSALGFGLMSVVPAKADTIAGTVSPVRYSETAGSRDLTPYASISWTGSVAYAADDKTVVVLTAAPTADAVLELGIDNSEGTATDATFAGNAKGSDSLALTGVAQDNAANLAAAAAQILGITVSKPGRYIGKIVVQDTSAANATIDEVTFDFTTVGAPTSFTVTSSATTSSPAGTTKHTVTLLDSNSKTTQPGAFDTFALTDGTSTGSFAAGDVSISAAEIFNGVYESTYTAPNTASTASTLTFTPEGVLNGLGAKTVTVTTDATTIDATGMPNAAAGSTGTSVFKVTAPANVTVVDGGADVDINDLSAAIPTGTATVTFTVKMSAASTTYRFKGVASAGTVNGGTTATGYVNAATNADSIATVTFTLAGNALVEGATFTITQANVIDGAVGNLNAVLTQTAPSITATSITQTPSGSIVRKLGDTNNMTVTVKSNFGALLGAGYVVNLYRGATTAGTLISTATTGADSTAVVKYSAAATAVAGASEQYSVQVVPPTGAAVSDNAIATVVYTATGGITSLSVGIAGSDAALSNALGATDAAISDTEVLSATDKVPAIYVPTSGTTAEGAAQTAIYDLSDGTLTAGAGAASNTFRLAANATDDNSAVYTTTTGAFVSTSAANAWNAGQTSLEVAEGTVVYVFATKVGLHTVTVTSGGKTASIRFWALNTATDYYTLTASADSSAIAPGSIGVVNVTVKDVFGNPVDTAADLLQATASGAVLLGGNSFTGDVGTGADGTGKFSVLANNATGTGTVVLAPKATGANAWLTGYTKPTGAADPVRTVTVTLSVEGSGAESATDAALEATEAANQAYEAAVVATETAEAAIAAAEDARAAAEAATAAVEALATQVSTMMAELKAQVTKLAKTVAKILKRV